MNSIDPNTLLTSGGFKFKQTEMVRLMMQSLYSMGYSSTAKQLQAESGVVLQSANLPDLDRAILAGDWATCLQLIPPLKLSSPERARFLIHRHHFLECVERGDEDGALQILQDHISDAPSATATATAPSASGGYDREEAVVCEEEVHSLASLLLLSADADDGDADGDAAAAPATAAALKEAVGWQGTHSGARDALLADIKALIPPSLLLPPDRLLTLLGQALARQTEQCVYHNSGCSQPSSLAVDHACQPGSVLPTACRLLLEGHGDEVWALAFSPNGRLLATASKDCTVRLWNAANGSFEELGCLCGHTCAVSSVYWSRDSASLLSVSDDCTARRWDAKTGECVSVYSHHDDAVTCGAWVPGSEQIVTGSLDKRLLLWSAPDRRVLHQWRPAHVHDVAVMSDGSAVAALLATDSVALCVRLYSLQTKAMLHQLQETHSITSMCLSADDRHLLLSVGAHAARGTEEQAIHCWDIAERRMVKTYRGMKQGRFVVRSSFGGQQEGFVVSGSEDCQVYLWHRANASLLEVLPGHTGTVNQISWSPTNPHQFASASDDHTVRVWGLPSVGGGSGSSSADAEQPPVPEEEQKSEL